MKKLTYAEAIQEGFDYLLDKYPEVFIIGQGLWSPWYVGNTMKNLEKKFGTDRVIDTPVSESATTGAAVGASITGMRPVVVHPRMDFMLYAMDAIVNEAAKWSFMFGGDSNPNITIRSIINRGGEQGAQHSQALHSWFAHIPGLRVVMPSTVRDARDLFISSVLSNDPVIFIDDRWLYEQEDELASIKEFSLKEVSPQYLSKGDDLTIVGAGYSSYIAKRAADELLKSNISLEVIDLRVINPFKKEIIIDSLKKTGRLLVVDGSWKNCSLSSEILASVFESHNSLIFKSSPKRITLLDMPAPTSSNLEKIYYPNVDIIVRTARDLLY